MIRPVKNRLVAVAEAPNSIVDFDREYRVGDERFTLPLRGTALLRWLSAEPHWQVFQWHASLRGPRSATPDRAATTPKNAR